MEADLITPPGEFPTFSAETWAFSMYASIMRNGISGTYGYLGIGNLDGLRRFFVDLDVRHYSDLNSPMAVYSGFEERHILMNLFERSFVI